MKRITECFTRRNQIEAALNASTSVQEEYELFHKEENRRQFFWYENFGNLAFISRSGEVYLLTPSVADQYGLHHVTYNDDEYGYLFTSCVYPSMAGGENLYIYGFKNASSGHENPYIDDWQMEELEEDISKFEESVLNVDKGEEFSHYTEETLRSHLHNDSHDWGKILVGEDRELLEIFKILKNLD